jgi:hypothetical protein
LENREVKNFLYYAYKREVEKRKRTFVFTDELKEAISKVGDFLTIETNFYGLFMPGNIRNWTTITTLTIPVTIIGETLIWTLPKALY